MDELTRRMHLVDVENVLFLFHHVVDSDNTVIEHNHQVVQADYQHGSTCVIVI
jgi:excinuclease UvrABC ATPase subunit